MYRRIHSPGETASEKIDYLEFLAPDVAIHTSKYSIFDKEDKKHLGDVRLFQLNLLFLCI